MIFDEKLDKNYIQVQNQKWGKYLISINLIIHSEYVESFHTSIREIHTPHITYTHMYANRKRGKKGNKNQHLEEELQIMGKLAIGL